jgi:1-deoxy-D-xylulose-5-phosphate reductoisomerase
VRDIVILGSTGSIGVQALEVIAANPELFRVVGLSAGGNNLTLLVKQVRDFNVPIVGVSSGAQELKSSLSGVKVIDGSQASEQLASLTCDLVLNAITGSIGLAPTLAALASGNKESLVAGGDLVMAYGSEKIIPVDSEHSALFQAMSAGRVGDVSKLILTASGGPFRDRQDLSKVKLADALAHPTWSMGPVVTINSATLVNKGLEIIEAHYLFDIAYSKIEAVIHPQSIVHSLVEFKDGSTLAQASPPDMKGPIAYALAYPNRVAGAMAPINWSAKQSWDFEPIDEKRFPAVQLARRAGALGSSVAAIYNAANEVAVAAFMKDEIAFTAIVDTIEKVVDKLSVSAPSRIRDISDVSAIEKDARIYAKEVLKKG